jgi:hypothetical protein
VLPLSARPTEPPFSSHLEGPEPPGSRVGEGLLPDGGRVCVFAVGRRSSERASGRIGGWIGRIMITGTRSHREMKTKREIWGVKWGWVANSGGPIRGQTGQNRVSQARSAQAAPRRRAARPRALPAVPRDRQRIAAVPTALVAASCSSESDCSRLQLRLQPVAALVAGLQPVAAYFRGGWGWANSIGVVCRGSMSQQVW